MRDADGVDRKLHRNPALVLAEITKCPSADNRMPRQKISSDCRPHSTSGRAAALRKKAAPAAPRRATSTTSAKNGIEPDRRQVGLVDRPQLVQEQRRDRVPRRRASVQLRRTHDRRRPAPRAPAALGSPEQPVERRRPGREICASTAPDDEQELPGERVEVPDVPLGIGRHRNAEELDRQSRSAPTAPAPAAGAAACPSSTAGKISSIRCTAAGCREMSAETAAAAP